MIDQGLAYLLNNAGVFTVMDVESGKAVCQKLLDLDPLQAHNEGAARGVGISLALAGGKLYVFGNNGAALVLEPGPRLSADRQEQDRKRRCGRALGRAAGTLRGQSGFRRKTALRPRRSEPVRHRRTE